MKKKPTEAINTGPSADPEITFGSEEIKDKHAEYKAKCGEEGHESKECQDLLVDIKALEIIKIRENYGRLLNNYYMTLAQYLVQCRAFEGTCNREWDCGLLNDSDLGGSVNIYLKKLWNDFIGEHTPKDFEGNPIDAGRTPLSSLLSMPIVQ